MAPLSALMLLIALGASFACCYCGMRVILRWASARRTSKNGGSADSVQGMLVHAKKQLAAIPVLRASMEKAEQARRDLLFKKQMPEAIRLLCIALDAGSSLVKALEYAANNAEDPLSHELKRTVWDLQAGQGFDEAMVHLRSRTGGSEFAYLAVAMEIQHRSGGSLSEVLQTVSGSLRKSSELTESLRTQTSQGRLSARVVGVMPVLLLAVFSVLMPDYLGSFVSSPIGVVMLFFAILLELGGIFWVKRTLTIDLSAHLGGEKA